ncbi:GrpB family protein [Microbacterium betulae]|uniref:GrpB family protein n=1 Tax=Microbacterium betulae TaxID=2981139 RepID=A0AA97I6Q7_9MICO|nr:GrpB family protein [Microbacterium sp. AB]WOF23412.1 GrpB family protein [Microbacterium sp. AB]
MPARDRPLPNPAELHAHDPAWAERADAQLAIVRRAVEGLDGASEARFDHIGSTSVPGLAAKPFVDLQVRILPLPSEEDLAARLGAIGYVRAQGSRPDSPGVHRDIPRGDETVPDEVWTKRLFVIEDGSVILHIRRSDSPWGRYAVWFRDWLRAHPDARDRYESVKRRLSAENRGKADYDDYTRAKTAFFDEVQDAFSSWARARDTTRRASPPSGAPVA